ncbi:MAG: thioredoxin domain-containing protein [Bdellovibrionota bacterium]
MDTSVKKVIGFFLGGVVLGALVTYGVTLSLGKKRPLDIAAVTGTPVNKVQGEFVMGTPLVKVDGQVYTTANLPGDAAMEYYMLESNIFNAKQNFADQVAIRIALAKDAQKKVDTNSLPKLAELLSLKSVSDAEAKNYYDAVVAKMGKGVFGNQPFEKIKPKLEARMNQEKASKIVTTKVQELQSGGRIHFLLTPPVAPDVPLNVAGYPTRGNQNSTVTLVEVADYLCPHCREAEPVMENIYKEYKDKIKFVQVSFPLAAEGLSGALTRGAYCANKQDQFWKYHSAAFQVPWEKSQAPAGQQPQTYFNNVAIDIAKNAGLEPKSFSTCLTSNSATEYIKSVQSAFDESKGFKGTPTFYLNNKMIQASPEQLESTLREALAK